ncbi:MAG: YbdD/YjiX family protein [Proteobacteria bacterium]|nr:YbdD/YjiX family protein [Pseudomonadota bacterium]
MPERAAGLARALLARLAEILRGAAGLDRYEHYLAHARRAHPGEPPLSRAEFFRRDEQERWSGVRRCC